MDEALLRQFEDMGPEAVRQWLDSGQMRPAFQTHAREWLGRNGEQQRKAVGGTKKINIAQSTADANWEAARAAKKADRNRNRRAGAGGAGDRRFDRRAYREEGLRMDDQSQKFQRFVVGPPPTARMFGALAGAASR